MNRIENTPEAKARFFALYIGQTVVGHECDNCNFKLTEISLIDCEVGLFGDWSGGTNPDRSCNDLIGIDTVWLNLNSLSQISDEDLVELYHIHSGCIAYDYTMDFKDSLIMAKHWRDMEDEMWKVNVVKYTKCAFYLISKGYYVGDGTEIEYGWVKLKGDDTCKL